MTTPTGPESRPDPWWPAHVPCPTWCDLPAGHGYRRDLAEPGLTRHHCATWRPVTGWAVSIEQAERAAGPVGPVELADPTGHAVAGRLLAPLTLDASDLRRLGAALIAAADQLDALTTGEQA